MRSGIRLGRFDLTSGGFGRQFWRVMRAVAAFSVALAVAVPAWASVEMRVRHVNLLLAEHPTVSELLGFGTTSVSSVGGDLLLRYHYSFLSGAKQSLDAASLTDLSGQMTTLLDPRLRCRVGPPFLDERGSACLIQQLRISDGAKVTFDLDDPAAEFLIMAVEDLIVMLKAREDALR